MNAPRRPTVLLADDHRIVLDGLRGLLQQDFEVVGAVHDGKALVLAAEQLAPDAIVVDVSMPLLNGIDATRQLRERGSQARIIVLSMHAEVIYASRALRAGAQGYVVKTSASEELIEALRAVLRGQVYVSPALRTEALDELLRPTRKHVKDDLELTPRQREILQLLAEGKSAKEIGAILGISSRTVETHKYQMMEVLGLKTSAQLVHHALKLGLS
jgi:DNA-binding NarL/FixJ family response regulator